MTQEEAEAEARRMMLAGIRPPPEVARLVRTLNLNGEAAGQEQHIPDWSHLDAFPALTALEAYWTNFDATSLDLIARHTGLTRLGLRTRVPDLSPLAKLVDLISLDVFAPDADNLVPLSALTGLTSLYVNAPKADSLVPLSSLTGLTDLSVYAMAVDDLAPLAALTGLRKLGLIGMQAALDLTPIGQLTALEHLDIEYVKVRNRAAVDHVATVVE